MRPNAEQIKAAVQCLAESDLPPVQAENSLDTFLVQANYLEDRGHDVVACWLRTAGKSERETVAKMVATVKDTFTRMAVAIGNVISPVAEYLRRHADDLPNTLWILVHDRDRDGRSTRARLVSRLGSFPGRKSLF